MTERKGRKGRKAKAKAQPVEREPTAREAAAIAKAVDYCRSRPEPLAYEVASVEGGDIRVAIPHSDAGGFLALQRATFGTVSEEFAMLGGAQLATVMRNRQRPSPTQAEINAGLAAVAGAEPQNEVEAMLAVQMAGVHSVAMDFLDRAKRAQTTDQLERFSTAATKMLRTYTAQVEALAKIKRGGSQKVTVEHVHVYQGGQAIVGTVTQAGGGAHIENGHQPHALARPAALALQAVPPVLCPDASRDTVPSPGGSREGPVPDARRGRRKRSAQG